MTKVAQGIGYLGCVLLIIGIICSKFLTTIAMIVLLLGGIIHLISTKDWKLLISNKTHLATIGIFFLILGSALLSENQIESIQRVRIALPLLILPLAFSTLPRFRASSYQKVLSIFLYSMTIASLGVVANYFLHFEQMQQLLRASGAIPTPNGEHIRFSLMVNVAIFAGVWLWTKQFYWKYKRVEKAILLSSILFLIVTIHILSVRTGLLALYTTAGLSILRWIVLQRRFVLGTLLLAVVFALPYLAVQYVPSVRTKFELTRYNIQLFNRGEIGEYSDTRRLLSYQIGLEVAQKSPWIGVGVGDLMHEQTQIYKQKYPEQKIMYPHNMFLTIYVATGIIGLLWFLWCFLFPLWHQQQYKHYFILTFFCIIGCSFLTENTLWASVGVAIYTFFLGLTSNYIQGQREV